MNNNLDKINESNDAVNSFRSTTGMYNDFNVQTEESIAKEAEVEQQKLDQPVAQVEYEEKACPKCGFKVAPGSKMCIHCGKLLSEEESTPTEVSINPEVTMQETSKVMQAPVKLGKTLSTKPIYIVNAVLFVICLIATLAFGMPYIKNIDIPFLKEINTYITLITIGSLVVTFFYGLCMQLLLYKASYTALTKFSVLSVLPLDWEKASSIPAKDKSFLLGFLKDKYSFIIFRWKI